MKKFCACVVPIAIAAAPAIAQDVTFRLGDVTGEAGQIVSVPITFDSSVTGLQGWQYGVLVDAPATVTGFSNGSAVNAFNGGSGPSLDSVAVVPPNGVAGGIIISFLGNETLSAGTDIEIGFIDVVIPATASIGDVFNLSFTDTLGSPAIQTVYIETGAGLTPAQISGSVTVVPTPATVTLLALTGFASTRRRR